MATVRSHKPSKRLGERTMLRNRLEFWTTPPVFREVTCRVEDRRTALMVAKREANLTTRAVTVELRYTFRCCPSLDTYARWSAINASIQPG